MKATRKIAWAVLLAGAVLAGYVMLRNQPPASLGANGATATRESSLALSSRARCCVCDRPAPVETRVLVRQGETEPLVLCAPHCFFVYGSSSLNPRDVFDRAQVTDGAEGKLVPLKSAFFVEETGLKKKRLIPAYADRDSAWQEQRKSGGRIVVWNVLRDLELSHRCELCKRAVYREDAGIISRGGTLHFGCCALCTLGLAAQTQGPVSAEIKDAFDGQRLKIKIDRGLLLAAEPKTAVAWAGEKKRPTDKIPWSGDFKQAWFVHETNLQQWLQAHPSVVGKPIALAEAVAAAMMLTKEQIIQTVNLH